ncbi:dihydrofolate reductase [Aequorivita viscosa]|uniref:Dihydrofolate reductase n=1 Tax=Aequorivita viscosa TaxID=797419 RepID=A0A1M6A1B8_9FLAO|nr:dihydrofolate reductase [Aequorivita viscosa]SDW09090.1 dihydrofolate reductase [Aequorivita viscosa]SHI29963.1 dihydrofolate reductase [Aequorivita viscosa]
MITLIAAAGENNELGKDNDLLWHLPDDFKRFKKITSHHFIIMGRKTFESFPNPLPNRVHIVITRDRKYGNVGAEVVHSLEEAIEKATSKKDIFVIGGGEIYKLAMDVADKIELTRVHGTFEDADTFFPEFSEDEWKLISEEKHGKDEKHKYAFTYETWVRK